MIPKVLFGHNPETFWLKKCFGIVPEKNFPDLAQSNFWNFILSSLSFKITFRIDLELSFTNVVEISLQHNSERMLITLPGSVAGRITVEIIN